MNEVVERLTNSQDGILSRHAIILMVLCHYSKSQNFFIRRYQTAVFERVPGNFFRRAVPPH